MSLPATTRRPRRIIARTLVFGTSALIAAGLLTWSPAATSGWNQGSAESTLWQLLNGARTNNGVAPVQQHGTLVSLARWRSQDMLNRDYFSHTIPGCGCQVYTYYDSNGLRYDWAGENIGWNSGLDDSYSPVRVHEKFMGSPGHRANVLDRRFTHGGVGAAAARQQAVPGPRPEHPHVHRAVHAGFRLIDAGPAPAAAVAAVAVAVAAVAVAVAAAGTLRPRLPRRPPSPSPSRRR